MNKIKKVLGIIIAILIVFLTKGFTEKTIVDKETADFISRGEYVGTKDNNNFYKVRPKYSYEDAQNMYNPADKYQYICSTGDIILTSRNPMRYSSSWLVIDEYDCMASHGASIGAIDEEELYYLMSRGLTRENSERLIVEGFIHPFINELKDESVKSYSLDWIKKVL